MTDEQMRAVVYERGDAIHCNTWESLQREEKYWSEKLTAQDRRNFTERLEADATKMAWEGFCTDLFLPVEAWEDWLVNP
jgi:hypothetical protein